MTTYAIICREGDIARRDQVIRHAESLVLAGNAVDIFAPSQLDLGALPPSKKIRITSLGKAPPTTSFLRALLFWIQTCMIVTLAQMQRRYHVVQVDAAPGPFVLTTWPAQRFGARIVIAVTGTLPEQAMARRHLQRQALRVRFAAFQEELAVDFCDHLIAPSEPMRTRLMSRGCATEKISVVYDAPDERLYGQRLTVERHASVRDRFLITCMADSGRPTVSPLPGSMESPLDLRAPLAAMQLIHQQIPNALLWVLCAAERRAEAETQVRKAGLASYVILQDNLPDDQLPAFIAQADVHLIAIAHDAQRNLVLPQSVLQSLALGVATVTTRTLATQYYFDARSLLTYDQENPQDLADRIIWLAQHAEARASMGHQGQEFVAQIFWSRDRQRYLALLNALAAADSVATLTQGVLARGSRVGRQRRTPIRAYRARLAQAGGLLPDDSLTALAGSDAVPLRITPPSQAWRQRQQMRLRVGAWLLRGLAMALLFGIPIIASHSNIFTKIVTAIMFVGVAVVMVILPAGEAAIIVALYFIAQRALFLQFPPEGALGPILIYLGTALQLIIFVAFGIRAIIQQRPLLRSGFVLWPASVYFVISIVSALANHVPFSIAVLGIEHTLHNLIFVVLIAEDLPSPNQLRQYVAFVIIALSAMATISIAQTGIAFGFLPQILAKLPLLHSTIMPAAVIVPDADTYGYLLNFGIFLALGAFLSLNSSESQYEAEETTSSGLNIGLLIAIFWLTFALFLTSSIENWVGLCIGILALAVILRGSARIAVLGFFGILLLLSVIPVQTIPHGPATSAVSDVRAILAGVLPHQAPLSKSIQVIHDHWLLGVGPGRFGGTVANITKSPIYQQYGFAQPHAVTSINLFWLHIFGETGIFGFLAFLWLMIQAGLAVFRAHRHGAHQQWWGLSGGVFGMIIAMCVATVFGNALEIDSLSAPFWALVAIAVALPIANRPLVTLPPVRFRSDESITNPEMPPVREGAIPGYEGTAR